MKIIQLTKIDDLDDIFRRPQVIIFKNSPFCPISRAARHEFERFAQTCDIKADLYMVDVISSRDISNKIAEKTGIKHESPQAILLKNGAAAWHASHMMITHETLEKITENPL
ncbi:bacillithiol system redox-active protein YtxJ [bacterium]|nr:bacillithiol system redox-active protein YtxJ [bacterium]